MYRMKLYVALFALFFTLVAAVDVDGFSTAPYCFDVTNGHLTRDGDDIDYVYYTDISKQLRGPSSALYMNGLNLGRYPSFLAANGVDNNGTLNLFPNKAAYWDFGIGNGFGTQEVNPPVFALVDGTFDTVDTAMAFTIDLKGLVFTAANNPSLVCSDNGVALHIDNPNNGLTVVQHFYVAKGQTDNWARTVAVVTNPTGADITAKLGFYNNLGSDSDTVTLKSTSRYNVTGDASDDTGLQGFDGFGDNPLSMHFSSQGSAYALPSFEDLAVGFVSAYWDVTVKAGETQSFMMILVQNRLSVQESLDNAAYIDTNPINIYEGISVDILPTLQNFNACAASAPVVTVSEASPCTTPGGNASFSVSGYDLSFTLQAIDSTGNKYSVVDGVVLPEGNYMLVAQLYEGCEAIMYAGTVTCPAPPTAPVAAPVAAAPQASNTPAAVPKGKTSSATTYHGLTFVMMSLVALVLLL